MGAPDQPAAGSARHKVSVVLSQGLAHRSHTTFVEGFPPINVYGGQNFVPLTFIEHQLWARPLPEELQTG